MILEPLRFYVKLILAKTSYLQSQMLLIWVQKWSSYLILCCYPKIDFTKNLSCEKSTKFPQSEKKTLSCAESCLISIISFDKIMTEKNWFCALRLVCKFLVLHIVCFSLHFERSTHAWVAWWMVSQYARKEISKEKFYVIFTKILFVTFWDIETLLFHLLNTFIML